MKNATAFTCYLIGQEQLLIDCVEILQSQCAAVKGIISSAATIKLWARQQNIYCVDSLADINWDIETVDYLFSITNREFIPAAVLAKVFFGTVVYHDSILPRYAGAHANAWAVLNQETSHGISWHLANELENGGAILKRAQIDVAPGITAYGLKRRCLALAVATFGELVEKLRHHALLPAPQDLALRTWFSYDQKPHGNGWVDWKLTAEQIDCYWRSTQFGTLPNTFATLKMICANEVLVIQSLRILAVSSDGNPGKVVAITEDHWQIVTGSSDLLVGIDVRNRKIKLRADILARHCNLSVNDQLTSPDHEQLQQFQAISERCAVVEVNWVHKLMQFQATPVPSTAHVVSCQTLPKTLYYHLLDFSRKPTELPLILLTAWLVYLFRLWGHSQISLCLLIQKIQIPPACRPFFSVALPCRFTISEHQNFVQQMEQVRQSLEAQQLQKPYLVDLWQRYPALSETVAPELQSVPVDMDFDPEDPKIAVEQLPDAFASLCAQLLLHTNLPVSEIEWLSKKEKQKILLEWNATDVAYPDHKTIHRLFEEQAYKTPQQIALRMEDTVLTYHELNCKVNQLAHYLITCHGIRSDEPVGVYLERGPGMLVAELGILKAGGVCLPLDPNWSASHIERILTDAKTRSVITSESLLECLHAEADVVRHSRQVLVLDSALSIMMLAQQSTANTRVPVKSDQLAFLFYAAPDHLRPQGVALEHRGIVNQILWLNQLRALAPDDRMLQHSSYVVHYSLLEFFWAIWFGATIVLSNDDQQCDPDYLCALIQQQQVTVVQLIPVRLHAMLQHLARQTIQLTSLRQIFCRGQVLDAATRLAVQTLLPRVRLHYLYGSAETSIHVLHADCLEQQGMVASRPTNNMRAYLLDQKLRPVPVGVCGELHISGDGLARGYLNQPDLTRQKFIPNPFQTEGDKKNGRHARLYKTGDFLFSLPGGQFEFRREL